MQELTDERLAELDVNWHESEGTYLVAVVAELIAGFKVERARVAELERQYEERTITSVHRAAERDALAARCAELEVERDHWKKRADDEYQSGGKAFRELVTTIKETEEAWTEETDALAAERDAAHARLDRAIHVWKESCIGWDLPRDVVRAMNVVLLGDSPLSV